MKKLYILLIAFLTFITLPGLQTQAASYTGNDVAIAELNGLTLNEVFRDANMILNPYFKNGTTNWFTVGTTISVSNQIMTVSGASVLLDGVYSNTINIIQNDVVYYNSRVKGTNDTRLHYSRNNSITLVTIQALSLIDTFEVLSGIQTTQQILSTARVAFAYRSGTPDTFFIDGNYGVYAINLTNIGISSITKPQLDYWFNEWKSNNAYIEGYDQGELDGYVDGLQDNTAYVQGYNVGYTDGLLEGVDMETGSSIIVLVLAALSFGFMIFGFSTKKRIFNLFAAGLFIALGGLMVEYAAFIIISIGFVIFNIWYTFASD